MSGHKSEMRVFRPSGSLPANRVVASRPSMKRNGRVKPCERLEGGQPSFHPGSLSGPFCLTSERALSPYGLKDQAEMRAAFIPSFPRRLFSVSPISAVVLGSGGCVSQSQRFVSRSIPQEIERQTQHLPGQGYYRGPHPSAPCHFPKPFLQRSGARCPAAH